MIPLRKKTPARSNVAQKNAYRAYKNELRADFNKRCGYCDDGDDLLGGKRGFHIDHFAPKKKFPDLETIYSNLVYSCPYCNGKKSDEWIGDDAGVPNNGSRGFVDPCTEELDEHLERDVRGRIISKTPLGDYMAQNLNLRLMRHELIWQADHMRSISIKLRDLIKRSEETNSEQLKEQYIPLLKAYMELNEKYLEYRRLAIET